MRGKAAQRRIGPKTCMKSRQIASYRAPDVLGHRRRASKLRQGLTSDALEHQVRHRQQVLCVVHGDKARCADPSDSGSRACDRFDLYGRDRRRVTVWDLEDVRLTQLVDRAPATDPMLQRGAVRGQVMPLSDGAYDLHGYRGVERGWHDESRWLPGHCFGAWGARNLNARCATSVRHQDHRDPPAHAQPCQLAKGALENRRIRMLPPAGKEKLGGRSCVPNPQPASGEPLRCRQRPGGEPDAVKGRLLGENCLRLSLHRHESVKLATDESNPPQSQFVESPKQYEGPRRRGPHNSQRYLQICAADTGDLPDPRVFDPSPPECASGAPYRIVSTLCIVEQPYRQLPGSRRIPSPVVSCDCRSVGHDQIGFPRRRSA